MVQRSYKINKNKSSIILSIKSQHKKSLLYKLYNLLFEKKLCPSNYRYLIVLLTLDLYDEKNLRLGWHLFLIAKQRYCVFTRLFDGHAFLDLDFDKI